MQHYQPTLMDDLRRNQRAITRESVANPASNVTEWAKQIAQLEQLCKSLRSTGKPDHSVLSAFVETHDIDVVAPSVCSENTAKTTE